MNIVHGWPLAILWYNLHLNAHAVIQEAPELSRFSCKNCDAKIEYYAHSVGNLHLMQRLNDGRLDRVRFFCFGRHLFIV